MSKPKLKRRTRIDEPFDSKLSADKLTEFTTFIVDELESALSSRSDLMDDDGLIDLWHALYSQESRNRKGPWPGSADLGSYIPTEKVDATRAKLVKIVAKAEPLCIVEGRGKNAQNAPIVEAVHEWHQQTEEKLFLSLVKWYHQSLIERVGILETYEKIERVVTVTEKDVLVQVDPDNVGDDGQPALLLENGQPVPERGTDQNFIDANPGEPQAKVKVKTVEYVHRGPRHRVVSGKDFIWIPAHARERDEEVIGYFKRFYRSNAQLEEAVKLGRYDKEAVEQLGKTGSRPQTATETRQNVSVQHTGHPATQEHELWEGQVFTDLDGDGPRWHIVTLSMLERRILRIKDDPIDLCRFTLAVLFPRESGIDGYSLVGDKLYSLTEEHASIRNQTTDRSTLANNAPILRMAGSKWKPQIQPWGPRQVIDITQQNELTQAQVRDVPESVVMRGRDVLQASERVSGASDIVSSGVVEGANPTATQIANSAASSNSRLEEQVSLAQESVEQLYQVRHAMLVRMLEFNEGQELDEGVYSSLTDQGFEMPEGKVTADMIKGSWRFKPRGSVESADPVVIERKFQQKYAALFTLAKSVPSVAMQLQNPEIGQAILQDWADTYKPRDRAPFLKPPAPPQAPMMPGGPFGAGAPGGQPPQGLMPPPGAGPMAPEPQVYQ